MAGVRVAWTVVEGSVFPESTLTDASGEATAAWVLGETIGEQTANATAFLNGSPRAFRATVTPAPNTLTWTAEQLPAISSCASPAWPGIWAASATDVFAVGNCGAIRHRNGSSWDLQTSGTTHDLNGVWGRSPTDVFAVGDSGTVLHYDGASWTAVAGVPSENVGAIWGTSSELFLLTGFFFVNRIWHYDGAVWTQQYQRRCPLFAIWGTSASDVFAVGPGGPLHYDGATWHDPLCTIADARTAVSGSGPGSVYATGSFECQSQRVPCTSVDFVEQFADPGWIRLLARPKQPGVRAFTGLWVGPNGDVVVVGVAGLILHGDGSRWRGESSGTSSTIIAVSGSEPASLWAITADGLVLHGTRANAAAARAKGRD